MTLPDTCDLTVCGLPHVLGGVLAGGRAQPRPSAASAGWVVFLLLFSYNVFQLLRSSSQR
jgi:hypothetical protein